MRAGHEQNLPKGHKRIYRPSPATPDEESFKRALSQRILEKVRTELEESTVTS